MADLTGRGPAGADVIGAVTLNLALDITYDVDRLVAGGSHRVGTVRQRAGGKGVNVARVAAALGHRVLALGLAGGHTGELITADLDSCGLPALLTPIAGESRRSVAVVDKTAGDATVFNEAGPGVAPDEWRAFCDRMPWGRLGVLVCSGSLPPGLPDQAYAELAARARAHHLPTVIDAGGPVLLAAAKAGAVVRANAAELRAALGDVEVTAGGRLLVESGAAAAVITDGAAGMVAVTQAGAWRATPVEQVSGNPTGAGDACTAVVAAHLLPQRPTHIPAHPPGEAPAHAGAAAAHPPGEAPAHAGAAAAHPPGDQSSEARQAVDEKGGGALRPDTRALAVDWPGVLRAAVAASSAAVLTPVAGDIDVEAYRRWLPQIVVEAC